MSTTSLRTCAAKLAVALAVCLAVLLAASPVSAKRPGKPKALPVASDIFSILQPNLTLVGAYISDVAVPNNGVRNQFTFTVPSGYYAIPLVYSATFQSDATVGNRMIEMQINEPGITVANNPIQIPAPSFQVASETRPYTFAVDVSTVNPGANAPMTIQIPRLAFPPKSNFILSSTVPGGADTFQSPAFLRVALIPFTQDESLAQIQPIPTPPLT